MITIEPPSTHPIPAAAALANPRPTRRFICAYRSLGIASLISLASIGPNATAQLTRQAVPKWRLTWSDEFNAKSGSSPDPNKWTFDVGGEGHGNDELETYTSRPANAQQKGGNLVITAQKEDHTGADGILRHYTSASIRTQGLFSQAYGRFEAHIQLPVGKGIWPAFWLLGSNIDSVGWPDCGELDIVENIGQSAVTYSTLHGPGYSGGSGISAKYPLPSGQAVNNAFHLYAVEWEPGNIKFFLDGQMVAERAPANLPPGAKWVYDHPFFIVLNIAVGGVWPGDPDATTPFPQQMLVDYVRVYSRSPEVSLGERPSVGPKRSEPTR